MIWVRPQHRGQTFIRESEMNRNERIAALLKNDAEQIKFLTSQWALDALIEKNQAKKPGYKSLPVYKTLPDSGRLTRRQLSI